MHKTKKWAQKLGFETNFIDKLIWVERRKLIDTSKSEGKYFIRPEKRMEDFPNGGYGGYVDYVLENLIQKPWKI